MDNMYMPRLPHLEPRPLGELFNGMMRHEPATLGYLRQEGIISQGPLHEWSAAEFNHNIMARNIELGRQPASSILDDIGKTPLPLPLPVPELPSSGPRKYNPHMGYDPIFGEVPLLKLPPKDSEEDIDWDALKKAFDKAKTGYDPNVGWDPMFGEVPTYKAAPSLLLPPPDKRKFEDLTPEEISDILVKLLEIKKK